MQTQLQRQPHASPFGGDLSHASGPVSPGSPGVTAADNDEDAHGDDDDGLGLNGSVDGDDNDGARSDRAGDDESAAESDTLLDESDVSEVFKQFKKASWLGDVTLSGKDVVLALHGSPEDSLSADKRPDNPALACARGNFARLLNERYTKLDLKDGAERFLMPAKVGPRKLVEKAMWDGVRALLEQRVLCSDTEASGYKFSESAVNKLVANLCSNMKGMKAQNARTAPEEKNWIDYAEKLQTHADYLRLVLPSSDPVYKRVVSRNAFLMLRSLVDGAEPLIKDGLLDSRKKWLDYYLDDLTSGQEKVRYFYSCSMLQM